MSLALDVNILLYASDSSSPHHEIARRFLQDCAHGSDVVFVAWPTIMGYLRMVTHPTIFRQPLSPEEAMANVESMLRLPHVRTLSEADGFWELYRKTTYEVPTRGNLVPDAHLAALLRQHGVARIATHDRDFRKFDFLNVVDPLKDRDCTD
jgi:toxin-antitoxin system PIN domain toxin